MLATTEQMVTNPSITQQPIQISTDGNEITLTVYIDPNGSSGYSYDLYSVCAAGLPGAQFTVNWILSPSLGLAATFNDPGVKFKSIPSGIASPVVTRLSDTEYQFTFVSNVTDVNVIRYDLDFAVTSDSGIPLERTTTIICDPSIAVVQDPVVG
jgi:hypothetical protein